MRSPRWSGSLLVPTAVVVLSFACASAWSDVVVLRDGGTIRGTISDVDGFVKHPTTGRDVAIISGTGSEAQPELRLVPVDEVDFVVLERLSRNRDGGGR